nr:DUF550 domain-containing protein [Salmonella enterica]
MIRLIQWADQHNSHYVAAALCELQERRKADSDPVGEFYEDGTLNWYQISDGDRVPANRRIPLYRHAQPVPEREQIRREHAEWSDATFGNVGPVGPLKHLSKEALEAAAIPSDPLEWADMQFLLWDAQRRAGITDEQITQAMIEKLAINKSRQWPEPKDGEPRLHIKEQPAPVVPDDGRAEFEAWMLKKWGRERQEYDFAMGKFLHGENYADSYTRHMWKAWTESRATMLQSKYRDLSQPVDPQISEYEKIMGQAGNSPVIPDGYVMVPKRLTAENGAKGVLSGEFSETKFINCPECFGDEECETCDGSGKLEITLPVTWTTIKAIWTKGVEHFAAAPQQEISDGK